MKIQEIQVWHWECPRTHRAYLIEVTPKQFETVCTCKPDYLLRLGRFLTEGHPTYKVNDA
jgi:hypothetical protein